RGTGVIWINGPGGDLPEDALPASSSCIQTTDEFAKANPETIKRLQQVVVDTAAFVKEEPEKAKAALAEGYPALKPEEIDLAFKQQQDNWTKPYLTEADMKHEIELLKTSAKLPGLDTIDAAGTILAGPQ
ncbi:MAG: hypothetical protein ACRECY_09800, partial [Phyllobacterium sp.]